MADVWTSFRRRFHVAALTKRNHVRVTSLHDIYQRSNSTHAQTIPRAKSVDYLNFCCQSEEEMEEIWKANLMVIYVCPSGLSEFQRRVETVKNAIAMEMDEENARDMRKYNLAKRREAICRKLLEHKDKKAFEQLGILGFEKMFSRD